MMRNILTYQMIMNYFGRYLMLIDQSKNRQVCVIKLTYSVNARNSENNAKGIRTTAFDSSLPQKDRNYTVCYYVESSKIKKTSILEKIIPQKYR